MVKPGACLLKVTLKSNIFLSYQMQPHTMMTRVMFTVENRSMVNRCIGQHSVYGGNYLHYISFVHAHMFVCDHIFGIENTELIVTHIQEKKLARN